MAAKKQPKEQGVIDLLIRNSRSRSRSRNSRSNRYVRKGLLADFSVELEEMQMLWSSLLNFGKDWLQLLKKVENSFPGGAQCFLWSFYFFHTLKSSAITEIIAGLNCNSKMNNLVPRTFSVARFPVVSLQNEVDWSLIGCKGVMSFGCTGSPLSGNHGVVG